MISKADLSTENAALRERLAELDMIIAALRSGAADALVGATGVLELLGTEKSYQAFFEAMNEGGVTLDEEGRILHCNPQFAQMTGCALAKLEYTPLLDHVISDKREHIRALLLRRQDVSCSAHLRQQGGEPIPAHLSFRPMQLADRHLTCLVVSDMREQIENERVLRESEERFRSLYSSMVEGVALHELVCDPAGVPVDYIMLDVNPAFESILGLTRESVIGQRASAVFGSTPPPYLETYAQVATTGRPMHFEVDHAPLDKSFSISAFSPGHHCFATVFEDITERKRADTFMRRAAIVFDNSQEGIVICDAETRILDVNPAFCEITGYDRDEVIGQNPRMLQSGLHDQAFYQRMHHALATHDAWRGEIWNRRKNGEVYAEILSINVSRDALTGNVEHYVAVFSDISQIKAHADEIDRIAHYDPLTQLPNGRLLIERLDQDLARAQRRVKSLAVCYLDLDGFKPVNDRFGRAVGDRLLVELTQRLSANLRAGDTLARVGGDEFVLLFNELDSKQDCFKAIDRLLQTVCEPIHDEGVDHCLTASTGVTLFPRDNTNAETLIRHADQAMVRAKESGKNCFHLYDPDYDLEMQAQLKGLQQLRRAFEQDEFVLYYQPKVDMVSGEVVGAEALIRWQHPQRGLLPPSEFLDLMAGTPLEIAVGEWVIMTTMEQTAKWNRAGLRLTVSANVSPAHLQRPDFVTRLERCLKRHPDVARGQLELEIVESSAIGDMAGAIHTMEACLALGVRFSLDDFGTGYSSLTHLRKLPISTLKIDQAFVRDILIDREDLGIVESIIRMAQVFDQSVIAEGVETAEHGEKLVQLGCRFGQGYGISRPMPPDAMLGWVAQWAREHADLTPQKS